METIVSPDHHHHHHHQHHRNVKLSTSDRNKLIRELLQGQNCAQQLHLLLLHNHKSSQQQQQQQQQQELVLKILTSFTHTLSFLTSSLQLQLHTNTNTNTNANANASSSINDSPSADDRRSEDSDLSKKRPPSKERRGCYKRKKNLQTWTVVSSSTEDAHAWRKYGQKQILNAEHPRSYFRCTHKYDQGCRATKQVQRTDNDPQMFETTYIGNHTCTNLLAATPNIIISDHPRTNTNTTTPTRIKQETSDDFSDNLSSLDSVVWEDLMPFESSDAAAAVAMVSDYGDVVSSTLYAYDPKLSSDHSFDVDLEREFHFGLETAEFF